MINKPLTRKQVEVFQFIKSFISKKGYPPTVREIANHMGYYSPSTAFQQVNELVNKGYIIKGNGPRMLQVVEQEGEAQERQAASSDLKEIKEAVQWFSLQMEKQLKANDHKGGWENEPIDWLMGRLEEKTKELSYAAESQSSLDAIIREAANVANRAMMIADNARRIIQEEEGKS